MRNHVIRLVLRSYSGATLAVAALMACARAQGARVDDQPTAVRVAAIDEEVATLPIVATGTVAARDEITLSFKIGGIVRDVLARDGDVVRAGQLLATLDLGEIDAQVSKASSAVAKADRDLARAARLYADSVATLAQYQDAATAADVARAELQGATFNRRYATIVAPAAGVIQRRLVESGELKSAGAPAFVLGSAASGTVLDVGLADRDVVRVRVGDRASVTFEALPARAVTATVAQVGAAASSGTGTYRVRLELRNAEGLATGMVGRAEITPRRGDRVQIIPAEAVVEADGRRGIVFILDEHHRARRVDVDIAFFRGGRAAVRGLEQVKTVVTSGAHYLDDAAVVKVVP